MCGGHTFASFFKNPVGAMLGNDKTGMRMDVYVVSRHDKDHTSEVSFRHHAVEQNISALNESPKTEILQVQPPSII